MTATADDHELLQRYARTRDEAAFAEIVRRHLNGVYSAALRRVGGDAHLAQDVAQRVFASLARKAELVARHELVTSWLYTVTRNEAANLVRTERRRRAREQEAVTMQNDAADNPADADWRQVAPVLDEVVDELSEADRAAILLRFVDRRPFAEIGAALRVSEDAARMRVDRAVDKLRVLLGRRGVTSTAAALGAALADHAVVAAPAGLAATVTGVAVAGGAATAAGALFFMSTGKMATTVVIAGGLAALGFGVYSFRQREVAELARVAAVQERDMLQANLRRADDRVRTLEQQVRQSAAPVAAATKPPVAPAASPEKAAAVTDDPALATLKLKVTKAAEEKRVLGEAQGRNPDMQRLMVQAERASFPVRFGALYAQLGLSPDQIARFEQRMAMSSETTMDIMAASQAKGLAPNDPAVLQLANQEKAAFLEDVRGILGEAGLREYQNYDRAYGAREAVTALLGNMLAIQAPLSADQVNRLTQIVADHSAGYQQGGRVRGRGQDVAWRDVLADAGPVLSAPQLEVLRAAVIQSDVINKMQGITDAMLKSRSDSGTASAPVPKG